MEPSEMDPAVRVELEAMRFVKPIDLATERGDSEVQRFYQDAVLFITGGTGFIGKQLLEKLFRSCNIKKAFILVRKKHGKAVSERLQDMLSDPVFGPVLKKKPDLASKLVCVEGNVTSIKLGINDDDWNMIIDEVDVIFHMAATIRFNENLDTATYTNVRGTREALTLSKACKKLRSFVHTSTAFSFATSVRTKIHEHFYLSPVPADTLLTLVDTLSREKLDAITPSLIKGWPNTYAFTKAVAEELVQKESGNLPVCIVRPGVVMNTYHEPIPGWLDKSCAYGPTGIIVGISIGVIRLLSIDINFKTAFVPVDYVNNATIATGWQTGVRGLEEPLIYNISTTGYGVTYKQGLNSLLRASREIATPLAVWYCFVMSTNNRVVYWLLSWMLHYTPAYILDTAMKLFRIKKKPQQPKSFVNIYRKYDLLNNVLSFLLVHNWHFNDTNLQQLWRGMSSTDRTIYNFDMSSIDWVHYTMMWVVGVRKYIMKDSLKRTKMAVARQKYFKLISYVIAFVFLAAIWKAVSCTLACLIRICQ